MLTIAPFHKLIPHCSDFSKPLTTPALTRLGLCAHDFAPPQMSFPLLLEFLSSPILCSPTQAPLPPKYHLCSPSPHLVSSFIPHSEIHFLSTNTLSCIVLWRAQSGSQVCLVERELIEGRWPRHIFLWHLPWCCTQYHHKEEHPGGSMLPGPADPAAGPEVRLVGRLLVAGWGQG